MSRNRVWVLVALVCALVGVPAPAYASDGFLGGLEDLTGTREVEQGSEGYEQSYIESYEPEVREVRTEPVRELDEDATTVDYINSTVDSYNTVSWGAQSFDLLQSIRVFFGTRSTPQFLQMWVLPAIGIVFLWWGVRKSKNMVMNAFRKGKASV